MIKICLVGASGRMGKELILATLREPYSNDFRIVSGSCRQTSSAKNKDLGELHGLKALNITFTSNALAAITPADIVIDFSLPESSLETAQLCAQQHKPLICGTTGFSNTQIDELSKLAKHIPLFWSANMVSSVILLKKLVCIAAEVLGSDFDIEILEAHHNKKIDAPSGTALMLGKAICDTKGLNFDSAKVLDRTKSREARKPDQIGFASLRYGDSFLGEHKIIFACDGEVLELTSRITHRHLYAVGALKVASWLNNQAPGKLYSMQDMLGL